ncbi:hypothetical protein R1flu_028909 [Riccia fluitans]|uniref:Uncharacterized protein n=1 Tax=Riccia fluitans TaxID=41844 RepID=A0ABD1XQX3_9MARC
MKGILRFAKKEGPDGRKAPTHPPASSARSARKVAASRALCLIAVAVPYRRALRPPSPRGHPSQYYSYKKAFNIRVPMGYGGIVVV